MVVIRLLALSMVLTDPFMQGPLSSECGTKTKNKGQILALTFK